MMARRRCKGKSAGTLSRERGGCLGHLRLRAAPVLIAVALVWRPIRPRRALWVNRRYRFSSWRYGRTLAVLVLVGLVLKVWMG